MEVWRCARGRNRFGNRRAAGRPVRVHCRPFEGGSRSLEENGALRAVK